MMIDRQARKLLFETVAQRVIASADELTDLDRAIGDGDHGANMRRGFEAVLAAVDELSAKNFGESLKGVGTTLVMKVGGASGPLYGTLFMSLGKSLDDEVSREQITDAFASAVDAVKARGKSDVGQKTMLDVLFPVLEVLREGGDGLPLRLRETARAAAEKTVSMRAIRGRASFLGERSIGHMDPGARSSALIVDAVADVMEGLALVKMLESSLSLTRPTSRAAPHSWLSKWSAAKCRLAGVAATRAAD
jgi:dihydroxyacetone kinase-like protein